MLEVFGGSQQPMTLSDLAKAADLPRATARRILFTLERAGFVASDGKLFRLTPRVLVLASSYLASNHVVSVLQPVLDRLSGEAQEISVDGDPRRQRRRLHRARQPDADIFRRHRHRLPAAGVLHLGRPRAAVAAARRRTGAALDEMDLAPLTPFTVTDRKLLLKTIIADRAQGYSLVDREAEPGFRSISVPVRRYDGAIVAAINMGAHVDRVSVSRDGRTLPAAAARGGGLGQVDAGVSRNRLRYGPGKRLSAAAIASNFSTICGVTR